ncbi:Methionyl-tRNA formyltransferase [Collinsella sp. AK_207A]|uniref:methionyl-tRNA formyltransferase n=1 Tax=Collinsella sp. AK_207A TaxID=2650472 RepID=UPI0012607684|nr:methionyl-tRNA formyltransferase [Collinsella sp. AK_207A]VWM05858.1 Methionyl-tRNA formyltransferase [Collinsella sp. AK_207A]
MRIVFMGTPDFAVPSLRALAAAHDVALVLTRPDAVRSRGKKLEPSPVKAAALELGLPVLEAKRMEPEVVDALRAARADVFCVAAYGCILPDEVLTMAPLGCVNVHASLLPRWRGAAPIQRAILAGDAEAGVSIMRIGHGVDTGAFCAQASCSVAGKSADELTSELAELGAGLLLEVLPELAAGTVSWTEQDEALVTHAAKIQKAELRLDPAVSAADNERRALASSDAAPARCMLAGKPVRVLAARVAPVSGAVLAAGELAIQGGRVLLGCGEGALEVLELKPDGKRAMDAAAWAAGQRGAAVTWEALS